MVIMAKIDGLTLEVKLDVSDEMAAVCVAYLKENDVVDVMGEKVGGHYQIHLVENATTEK